MAPPGDGTDRPDPGVSLCRRPVRALLLIRILCRAAQMQHHLRALVEPGECRGGQFRVPSVQRRRSDSSYAWKPHRPRRAGVELQRTEIGDSGAEAGLRPRAGGRCQFQDAATAIDVACEDRAGIGDQPVRETGGNLHGVSAAGDGAGLTTVTGASLP